MDLFVFATILCSVGDEDSRDLLADIRGLFPSISERSPLWRNQRLSWEDTLPKQSSLSSVEPAFA